jgi:superfamily I DNA and RNA helicase
VLYRNWEHHNDQATPFASHSDALERSRVLDKIIGPKSDADAVDRLLEQLAAMGLTGTVYVGYPLVVLPDGRPTAVDVLLTCLEHGVVIFDFYLGVSRLTPEQIGTRQRELRKAVEFALVRSGRLTVGNKLIVDVRVLTVDPSSQAPQFDPQPADSRSKEIAVQQLPRSTARYSSRPAPVVDSLPSTRQDQPSLARYGSSPSRDGAVAVWENIAEVLRTASPIDPATLRYINAGVQRLGATRLGPANPGLGALAGPRAATLIQISDQLANMDECQKAAAIEMPDGPQRIRGLAGSGKTIVLAFKAALLHFREPRWRIAVTFYTRTLYEPFQELIRRFYREHTGGQEPNWKNLRVLHAWGAKGRGGVYSEIAQHLGVRALGSSEAMKRFKKSRVFEGVCDELVAGIGSNDPEPLYNAVLIDEAQDLPASFMEMVYRVTSPPKRVVWAYDDLQNITDYEPAAPAHLFGKGPDGSPRVPALTYVEGDARPDIILPMCYRNTPWALTVAHALGLGVYRVPSQYKPGTGLIQFYADPELWNDIGYTVERGSISPGEVVTLSRDPAKTPQYFKRLINPNDAVQSYVFPDSHDEAEWVAEEILRNLNDDGLTPRQVLIVSANPYFRDSDAVPLVQALTRRHIPCHIAGAAGHVDVLFGEQDSIPIASINRAKGNEAWMVYVVQAEHGASFANAILRRNALFSAITRCRAWVRVTGVGGGMRIIQQEIENVVARDHKLVLTVPTAQELSRMRKLRRDMSKPLRRRR